jgi:hypothetical protein
VLSLLLLSAALADAPASMSVSYSTTFDLAATVDKVCPQTGLCDCTVRYEGRGTLVEASGDRWTYQGTYKVTEGSCHSALMLWAPSDGKAFHTVRVSGDTVTEWIAHRDRDDTTRKSTGIKEGGQVYLYAMSADIDDGVARHSESEAGKAGPLSMTSSHSLVLSFE